MIGRRDLFAAATALAVSALAPRAGAKAAWPSQVLRLVNPNVPGGTSDILGRMVSGGLGADLGTTVIVDNRPGGNGNVGAALVAKATDQHTLLISDIPTLSISALLYKDLAYSLERDLQGVAMLAYSPHLFAVHAGLPVKTLPELVAFSRTRRINVALPFLGTPNHLAALELAQRGGLRCQFVPYKGGAQALTDTVGGTADLVVTSLLPALPLVKAGRLQPIGVAKSERTALLPGVPTIAEQGAPGFASGSWQGITAPATLATEHVQQIQASVARIVATADTGARLAELGAEPAAMEPRRMTAFIREETARWAAVIAKAGGQLEAVL